MTALQHEFFLGVCCGSCFTSAVLLGRTLFQLHQIKARTKLNVDFWDNYQKGLDCTAQGNVEGARFYADQLHGVMREMKKYEKEH